MTARKIIHVDLDAFYCAVEELRHPELCGKPFAVGGRPGERGVVSSCSYPARRFGVHSAMPTAQALRLCPQLVILPGNYAAYSAASQQVMEIFRDLTPLVEQISIDEAFLDVSDLPQSGLELAQNLQARVRKETSLPCSLGVATNKLVAKIASDTAKKGHKGEGAPSAILVVRPGGEAEFLAELPVQALWGVGPKTAVRLAELNFHKIGDLARASEGELAAIFGKNGRFLFYSARGEDSSPVVTSHEIKSVSEEVTFDRDIADEERLLRTLRTLSEGVGRRLRKNDLAADTVRLKLRWPNFTTPTRQVKLACVTDQDGEIFSAARLLFEKLWAPGRAVRLLGVGVSGLQKPVHQLNLFEETGEKERKLLEAIDTIHEKYGKQSIRPGYSLRKNSRDQQE